MASECPMCGESFSSEQGMKSHYAHVHNESIAGFEYECDFCGESVEKRQRLDDQNVFCSKECSSKYKSENWNGEDHPKFEGVIKNCMCCGEKMAVSEYEAERKKYCSVECKGKDYSERFKGDGAPAWKDGKVIECPICENGFRVAPWEIKERTTCSTECYSEYRSREYSGSNHPQWKGGGNILFGPKYRENRERVIERDGGKCQICGKRFDDVHHIKPRRKFYEEAGGDYISVDWEQCNSTENLICLCKKHHEELEGKYIECNNSEFVLVSRSESNK